jgi:hypothetical protein
MANQVRPIRVSAADRGSGAHATSGTAPAGLVRWAGGCPSSNGQREEGRTGLTRDAGRG